MEIERRPWGGFEVLSDAPTHKVKRLTVEPGRRLSYQRYQHWSEHWFVVGGLGVATIDGSARQVGLGDTVDIPAGAAHRIESIGTESLVFIEVQHGTSFEEDDIERLEDDYGRVPQDEVS